MTELMQKAVEEVNKLTPAEQDVHAKRLLEQIEGMSEARYWVQRLAGSNALIDQLAVEALEEHLQGKTRPLEELISDRSGALMLSKSV